MNPLVSVVIPVYNAASTIVKTLDSVINQTYKNLEIILVDDGSKDDSLKIIEDKIKLHPDVQIKLISKKNGGVSSARNAGIDAATGDFIAFLDSDDLWLPKKIEIQLTIYNENPYIDCLGTTMNGEQFKKMFGVSFERLTRITPKMILLKNFLCIQTTLIRKNVIDDIGYFFEDQDNEDSNMVMRISNKYNSYLLNESFVIYYPNVSGVSSRLWEMEKGELTNVKKAVEMKILSPFEAPFYAGFSLLKFSRRVLNSFLAKLWKK